MISKEELEKFTVIQLKEKLKSRKLQISGTKPELLSRLYESILAEEKLLGNMSVEDDAAGPSEFDLANVDVDEVLGTDSEVFSPVNDNKKNEIDSTLENSPIKHTTLMQKMQPPIEKNQPKEITKAALSLTTNKLNSDASSRQNLYNLLSDTKPIKFENNNDSIKKENGEKQKNGLSTEDGQKMLQISKRLGLPCKNSTENNSTILAKRVERFGPVNEEEEKKHNRLQRFGLVNKDDKIAKRIARFGAVNDNEDLKKKTRIDRFNVISKSDDQEKLRKRAERFGI